METKTAKLFRNGRSIAVRLPKAWVGDASHVEMEQKDGKIVVKPKRKSINELAEMCRKIGGEPIKPLPQTYTGIRVKF